MVESATVIVGMSVADAGRRDELAAYARDHAMSIAFLQMAAPSLGAELTRLADEGVRTVTLIGVDHGPISPGQSWLRRIAAHWWREYAGIRPQILIGTELARSITEIPARAAAAISLSGDEAGLTSPAWESVSGHKRQVMICRGPRCTANGATENIRALLVAMATEDLSDADALVIHTSCQFPCNQAPVINVQPDDVWYGSVDPNGADLIARQHLRDGEVVTRYQLLRAPQT